MENREKFDIAILDSGLEVSHSMIKCDNIKAIHIYWDDCLQVDNNIKDTIGHGTAVYYIIKKENKEAKILIVKIFDHEYDVNTTLLINALKYINENYDCKVINLSNGVSFCDNIGELEDICKDITNNGTYIVAGFANNGSISYPAAFPCVIGVDISLRYKHIYEFEYVEGSVINIRACGITQRLPWIKNEIKRVSGTSFSCPYITSYIYQAFHTHKIINNDLNDYLKKNAKFVHKFEYKEMYDRMFKIHKAVVFPFNKEVHSIVKFSNLLNFNLIGVYDSKYLGNIGKSAEMLLQQEVPKNFIIEDINLLDWTSDFDTIIIGHTRELNSITDKNYQVDLFEKCLKYNKNIFAFDDMRSVIEKYNMGDIKVYTPMLERKNIVHNNMGKLYNIGVPILCVVGTSSKQGKYTIQLKLREAFLKKGYKVGGLGTEPSAELFGMDEVFPMGYDNTVFADGIDQIMAVNYKLHQIELKQPDIIITGSQSQTIAHDYSNLKYIALHQNNFLNAVNADGFILVCNYYDDLEYISRTIKYLNHFNNKDNIIAIAMFPVDEDLQWAYLTSDKNWVSRDEAEQKANVIKEAFHKDVYIIGNNDEKLFEACIAYFTED